MGINFELYKVFYYVGYYRSFSGAAKRLFISQSAVSQSIKQLEEQLDTRLFLRNSKRVKLTQEGEVLFEHIQQAFNAIRAGERSLIEIRALDRGEIRIAASDTICKYYLLPYFEEFHRLYPAVQIRIFNRTSPVCLELVRQGLADLSIVNIPQELSFKHFSVHKVKIIQDVFVAGKSFSSLKGREMALRELERYPVLMLEKNTVTRQFFQAYQESQGVSILPEIESSSLDLLIELAKIGLGISLVPREFLSQELASGSLFVVDIQEKLPVRYLGIITSTTAPLSPAAAKFAELLLCCAC